MPSTPSRGPITSRVIAELETEGFPVGDNEAPAVPYGWSGDPNEENQSFTPWMTVTAMTAQAQRPSGAIGDTGTEWVMPYSVFYAGMTRKQCEALADRLRAALCNINRETVATPSGNWKIQKISCSVIGSSNRIGSAYPDYFTQADTFEVWITKGN